MRFVLEFICRWCANNADAGNLEHSDCGTHCDCQHGTPKEHSGRRH